jgi:hypothetical protein
MAAPKSPPLDLAFVQRWSHRYAYESMLFSEVGPAVRGASYLTKDQLTAVGRWKSTRRLGLVKALDGGTVVPKTRQALGMRTGDEDRHRVIAEPTGVGVPMASALLTVRPHLVSRS